MRQIVSAKEMQGIARGWKREGKAIGFVPTMGFLHEGHLSLIRRARGESDVVVVSVFVNPMQFGAGEDFERYPRDMDRDRALCEAEGAHVMFAPEAGEMYAKDHSVYVEEKVLSQGMCGKFRPGHFQGVTTVVMKLFHIVLPDKAFFGQKDAQQTAVVRRMVRDLQLPVEIVVCPTVREEDGLAMSSRNAYLTPDQRGRATGLYQALCLADGLCRSGVTEAFTIREKMRERLEEAMGAVDVDYIELADPETLRPVERVDGPALAAVAVRLGTVRLIDNMTIGQGRSGAGAAS